MDKGDKVAFSKGLRSYHGVISDVAEFDRGIFVVEYTDKRGRSQMAAISHHNVHTLIPRSA